jgi:hypothetical protein
MAAKTPAAKQPAMEQPAGNVVRNLTGQSLSIGGVTIAPGGEAIIDNWDAVKSTPVIVAWLSNGIVEVANGAS